MFLDPDKVARRSAFQAVPPVLSAPAARRPTPLAWRVVRLAGLLALLLLAASPALALEGRELERTEALLAALAQRTELTFVRNGCGHDARQAAAHLRRKLVQAGGRASTAEEFIDGLASSSSSSASGPPYLARLSDGQELTANEFFHALLQELAP
ncbi:MAG: DUF5329 family protein [Deltaproteobacteria bacterium]|jgi:hypothetical protein|nr:DUF5329 family protein [Deltaproteobacteria bacterium]